LTCKNHLPYNLYCVGGDVKHCSLTHSLTCLLKCFLIYSVIEFMIDFVTVILRFIKSLQLIMYQFHNTSDIPIQLNNANEVFHTYHLLNSLLHSVNLIVFTLLLAQLILRISPHHSHHLRSHHLSLPRPFTPDLKLIFFTNPFLHSHSYSFRTDFTVLNLYCIKGTLELFVLVSFSGYVC